jgi:hypothetical protein
MIRKLLLAAPLAAASFVTPAFAASAFADVPFSFSVGSIQMPAGHYRIDPQSRPSTIVLTNVDTGRQVQLPRRPGEGNLRTLVFERGSHSVVLTRVR